MMNKFKRWLLAAVFGMAITVGLTFFMMALISHENHSTASDNYLTTQVKLSAPPGLEPAKEINSDAQRKHHQLPSKRKVLVPINHKSMLADMRAQEADGDQQDPHAAPKSQQKLLIAGSQSQASVKLAGKFTVIGHDPQYPDDALREGQEGWVEAMIHVQKDGQVHQVDILNAGPQGVFEQAVVKAVIDWRLQFSQAPEADLDDHYFHRFEFKITE